MNGIRRLLCIVIAWLALAGSAEAATRVLVLGADGAPPPAGFVDQLRIQLAGRAEIVGGGALDGGTPGERVAAARRAGAAQQAGLVVWVERPGGGDEYVLYVVGEVDGRALVEVFRLPAGQAADTARALALQVAAVLDGLLAPAEAPPVAWVAPILAKARTTTAVRPVVPPRPRVQAVVELDVGGVVERRGAGGLAGVAAGAAWPWFGGRAEATAAVWLGATHRERALAGEVTTDEDGGALGLRLLWPVAGGRWSVGGGLQLGARRVHAVGVADDGSRGEDTVLVPVVVPALRGRFRLGERIALDASVGVSWMPRRQRFAVQERLVTDLGRVDGMVIISLVISLP